MRVNLFTSYFYITLIGEQLMKFSLRHKIIAVNLTVLFLTFAVISFIVIDRLSAVNINMLVENLKHQGDLSVVSIRQSLLIGESNSDLDNAFTLRGREFAAKLSNEYNVNVEIFSSSKQSIAKSGDIAAEGIQYPELNEVYEGNRTFTIRRINGDRYLHFCFPVVYKNVIGAVMFIYPLKDADAMTRNIQVYLLVSFIIGLMVIVAVGMFLSVQITKPILRLKDSAIRIARGNFSEYIDINSSDETGELAKAFNTMSHEIENRISIINMEKSKLNSILDSMGEGVVALDSGNSIILVNDIAKNILSPELKGKVLELSDKVRKNRSRTILELEAGDRSLLICATPLKQASGSDGIVLILNDVTELRLLQEKQKQFVTNVSHELRTPLTTILGYVDLLKEKGGNREIFNTSVDYLQSASDRLLRLVNDLIDLSTLNKSAFEIEPKSTNMAALVGDIVGQMSLKAHKYGIKLNADLPDTSEANIDPVRLKQAVVNILDNAIKYSQGENISVNLIEEENWIRLIIKDNGCGIPKDLLDNVFEPFYRIDKARSRDMGGNGLGLAITKEIIDKHGGNISIESAVGKGTTVAMSLPKRNSI